jgi:hypothetical protein
VLVIKLDLSKLPGTLKSLIMNQLRLSDQTPSEPNPLGPVIIQSQNGSEENIHEIKRRIKDILITHRIRDFVAITDPVDHQKVSVVERKEAEGLDSYHCIRCGMEFVDKIQLGIHQRLHLPF